MQYSTIVNCPSTGPLYPQPIWEHGAGVAMSYVRDQAAGTPRIGDTYYVRVTVAVVGMSCAGHYADIQLALPPGTQVARTAANPIVCLYTWLDKPGETSVAGCPQTLSVGSQSNYLRVPFAEPPARHCAIAGTRRRPRRSRSTVARLRSRSHCPTRSPRAVAN